MQSHTFEKILAERTQKIHDTLGQKAKEYQSLLGMLSKHLVSVLDLISNRTPPTKHLIDEKIGDTINYLILLEAVLIENLPKEEEKKYGPVGPIYVHEDVLKEYADEIASKQVDIEHYYKLTTEKEKIAEDNNRMFEEKKLQIDQDIDFEKKLKVHAYEHIKSEKKCINTNCTFNRKEFLSGCSFNNLTCSLKVV
jgi:hypothetical protein